MFIVLKHAHELEIFWQSILPNMLCCFYARDRLRTNYTKHNKYCETLRWLETITLTHVTFLAYGAHGKETKMFTIITFIHFENKFVKQTHLQEIRFLRCFVSSLVYAMEREGSNTIKIIRLWQWLEVCLLFFMGLSVICSTCVRKPS